MQSFVSEREKLERDAKDAIARWVKAGEELRAANETLKVAMKRRSEAKIVYKRAFGEQAHAVQNLTDLTLPGASADLDYDLLTDLE